MPPEQELTDELRRLRLGQCWVRDCLATAFVRATLTNRTTREEATGLLCDEHEAELSRDPRLEIATESVHSDDPGEFARPMTETMTPYRFQERVRQLEEETAAPPDSLWWLSFADSRRPKGDRFLGACMVVGSSLPAAITRSHELGINPGGEVMTVGPIAPREIPSEFPIEQLLSREVIDKFDETL